MSGDERGSAADKLVLRSSPALGGFARAILALAVPSQVCFKPCCICKPGCSSPAFPLGAESRELILQPPGRSLPCRGLQMLCQRLPRSQHLSWHRQPAQQDQWDQQTAATSPGWHRHRAHTDRQEGWVSSHLGFESPGFGVTWVWSHLLVPKG